MEAANNWEGIDPQDLVVPDGYIIHPQSKMLFRKTTNDKGIEKLKQIAFASIWIVARMRDVETDEETWTLRCDRPNEPDDPIRRCTVLREHAQTSRELIKLAGKGLLINSKNATDVVEFLAAFEVANAHLLPLRIVTSVPGWQIDGTFLVGDQHITPKGSGPLRIIARTDGEAQALAGYHRRGTFEAWKVAAAQIAPYPRVVVTLLACLAAPLLHVLGEDVPNFMLNLGELTGTGKSTAQRIGASVWGNPNEHAPNTVFQTWNVTKVGIERLAAIRNGLPLILDDTRNVDPDIVSQVIYLICAGQGKTRGALQGLARTASFRTIGISSGERSLRHFYKETGGAVLRTLEISGNPFHDQEPATKQLVEDLNETVLANYGHAGPILLAWLLHEEGRADRWADLRARYLAAVKRYGKQAENEAARLAAYAAILEVTAYAASEALELAWLPEHPMEAVWDATTEAARDADDVEEALRLVYSWACGNSERFYGRRGFPRQLVADAKDSRSDPTEPPGGWAGNWLEDWKELLFLPSELGRVLALNGYPNSRAVIEGWLKHGWMRRGKKHWTVTGRVSSKNTTPMYAIKREALEKLDIDDDEPTVAEPNDKAGEPVESSGDLAATTS